MFYAIIQLVQKNHLKGIIYLLITAIIWGGAFISQFFGGRTLGSFTFNGYRSIFGCLSIAIMIFFDSFNRVHKFTFFRDDEDIKTTILNSFWCGIFLFLALITQQVGVEMTDTAKAGLIASLEVICVPIILFIFYKRRVRAVTWIFIVTAMLGIMMLSVNSLTGINNGDIWVLASTILYSITIIQIPKYVKTVDPLKFSFFRFVIVGVLSFLCALIFKERPFDTIKVKSAIMSVLYSGILASGVAYTFQVLGQKYCEPVIATLVVSLGWLILGQSLNFIQIIGIIITFISIVIVQLTDNTVYS